MDIAKHLAEHAALGIGSMAEQDMATQPFGDNSMLPASTAFVQSAISRAVRTNDIGIPGTQGFGIGVHPGPLPAGRVEMYGTRDPASDNYGNYQCPDGSVVGWIPAFYYRIGHADNPTYGAPASAGVDSVDIKPESAYANVAAANAAGYALHRAFIDGGAVKRGFWFDKYKCSNNAGIASSLKNGNPISAAADHNPISGLTGAMANIYGSVIAAAKTRGADFHGASVFQYAALASLSLAHGQAATGATWCAWYDAARVTNFPKGCNNNALQDANDTSVLYVSDGYSNCGKTGSGTPFARTTHNGQACGIADLNGLMWEVAIGMTCIATTKTITAATQANPVQLIIAAHGYVTGGEVMVQGVVGMTQINDRIYTVTVVDANSVTLNGVDGTAFTAYASGGTATVGTFCAAKESVAMKDFTGGNTLATDHWGATGVAAMMDPLGFSPLRTDYPNNTLSRRYGDSAAQVLDPAVNGAGHKRTALGLPLAPAIGASGVNRFGQDYYYQYIRNELALIVGANWNSALNAGVWARSLHSSRAISSDSAGFRAASYL